MKIATARFGEVEIDPAKIITLNEGMVGFPNYKRYAFMPFMEGTPFELFQAVDHGNLAFVTVNPFLFCEDFQFEISDDDLEALQVKSKEDITIKVIVTIPEDPKGMTANLQGPLVINEPRLLAKQIILHDAKYGTKHPVFSEAK